MPADNRDDANHLFEQHLTWLMTKLLKWQHRPQWEGSWGTIRATRKTIASILQQAPTLSAKLHDRHWLASVWANAVEWAEEDTGLDLPKECPWDIHDQVLAMDWIPAWAGSPPAPSP